MEGDAYELVSVGAYVECENVRVEVTDGFYQNGDLSLELEVIWIGNKDDISVAEFEKVYSRWIREIFYVRGEQEDIIFKCGFSVRMPGTSEYEMKYVFKIDGKGILLRENKSVLVCLGEKEEKELLFTELEQKEIDVSQNTLHLPNGNSLTFGLASKEEQTVLVTLSGTLHKDYEISSYLLNTKYGIGAKELEYVSLTDSEGNCYNWKCRHTRKQRIHNLFSGCAGWSIYTSCYICMYYERRHFRDGCFRTFDRRGNKYCV